MPTFVEYEEAYEDGYAAGYSAAMRESLRVRDKIERRRGQVSPRRTTAPKPKRKLSAWNKFVKANSKKPRFRYRNGKLNLKKMAVAFRKTPAGRKKRR